jgi:hypothetical protein
LFVFLSVQSIELTGRQFITRYPIIPATCPDSSGSVGSEINRIWERCSAMPRLSVLLFLFIASFSFSQEWTSISPIPTIGRDDGVAFSLNNLGFVVTGSGDDSNYSESNRLFCYNPETNSWTEKAPFPGVKRQYSSVFTIDDIAYLIGGYSEIGTALNDVWSYDAALDEWIQRSNFPGLQRWDATSTSMSRVGYYGLGTTQICTMTRSFSVKDFLSTPVPSRILMNGTFLSLKTVFGD